MMIGAVCVMAAHAHAADGPYYIHHTEVNLRAEPNGEILLTLDVNDKVFVIEQQGDWSYVSAPAHEKRGWVWSAYYGEGRLNPNDAVEIVPPAPAAKKDDAEDKGSQARQPAPPDKSQARQPAPPTSPPAETAQANKAGAETAKNDPDKQQTAAVVEQGQAQVEDLNVIDSGGLVVATYAPDGDDARLIADVPDGDSAVQGADNATGALPPHDDGAARVSDGFIPDNTELANASAGADASQGGAGNDGGNRYTPMPTIHEVPPPVVESQPPAEQVVAAAAQTEASGNEPVVVEFYQPFAPKQDITVPASLGTDYYPVGGNNIALITGSNVNVRGSGSLNADVVGRVNSGDKCYLMGEQEGWCYVSIPGKNLKGWVSSDYVNKLPRVEITGDTVRLREAAGTDARIKAELNKGDVFYKFDESGKWALVASSSSGLKGWVHQDYLKKTTRQPSRPYKVTGDDVNFRVSPEVDSDIITALNRGTTVQVLGRNDKWSFIQVGAQQGWMYSQYLDPDFKGAPRAVYGKSIGGRLIARAKAMEGTPYVWGGESDSGVDCSGLIYKLLLDEGADASNLPRRASTQMAGLGQPVDKEDLEPGDLVFFHTYKEGASHVGIYLGDGDFIHASSAHGKVCISNMSEGYYKRRFVGARRITEAELRSLK